MTNYEECSNREPIRNRKYSSDYREYFGRQSSNDSRQKVMRDRERKMARRMKRQSA